MLGWLVDLWSEVCPPSRVWYTQELSPRRAQQKVTIYNLWFQQQPHSPAGRYSSDLWDWSRSTLRPGVSHQMCCTLSQFLFKSVTCRCSQVKTASIVGRIIQLTGRVSMHLLKSSVFRTNEKSQSRNYKWCWEQTGRYSINKHSHANAGMQPNHLWFTMRYSEHFSELVIIVQY